MFTTPPRRVSARSACSSRSNRAPAPMCSSRSASRSEEHTSELQSLMRTSYDVFCLKKKHESIQRIRNRPSNTTCDQAYQHYRYVNVPDQTEATLELMEDNYSE